MKHKIWLMAVLLSSVASAQDFTWNGVATQAVFHSDANNIYGKSEDDASFDFTEISLNASYNLPNAMRLSAQGVYRHAGAGFDGVNLDYLFLDKQLLSDDEYFGGIRVGRVKNSYGLYNDSRDVAFTRPSIYLPQAVYLDLSFRNTFLYADGLSLYLEKMSDFSFISFEAGVGYIDSSGMDNYQAIAAFSDSEFEFDADEGYFYRIKYATLDERIRIAFSDYNTNSISASSLFNINPILPEFGNALPLVPFSIGAKAKFTLLSLEYAWAEWVFAVEYGQISFEMTDVSLSVDPALLSSAPFSLTSLFPTLDLDSEVYFFQATRSLSPKLEAFLRADVFLLDKTDPNGAAFEQRGRGVAHSRFAKDYGIGIRWHPRLDTMMMLEYHYVDGAGWLNPQDNLNFQRDAERYWSVVAASVSYRF